MATFATATTFKAAAEVTGAAAPQDGAASNGAMQSDSGASHTMTTAISIAAPVGGVALVGAGLLVLYKKGKMGCFRRAKRARRGSMLEDSDSVQNVHFHDKFDPARNY